MDPDRRRDEQERNTDAHRRVQMDPDRRRDDKKEILQLNGKFVWMIHTEYKENKKETLQLIKWPIEILLQE